MTSTKGSKPKKAELEQGITHMSATLTLTQTMLRQTLQRLMVAQNQLNQLAAQVTDMQYRERALLKILNIDPETIESGAAADKTLDWNEASEEDTRTRGLVRKDKVTAGSDIVVWTSEAESGGVFRSKVRVEEVGPVFASACLDRVTGETFEVELQGSKHNVTLLEIFEEPSK